MIFFNLSRHKTKCHLHSLTAINEQILLLAHEIEGTFIQSFQTQRCSNLVAVGILERDERVHLFIQLPYNLQFCEFSRR